MKASMTLKALTLALVIGSFGFAGAASAGDDDDDSKGELAIGIIGQVIGGALEAEAEKAEEDEVDRRCRRLERRCEEGSSWACAKQDAECGD